MNKKITHRVYLTRKALMVEGASPLGIIEAVSSVFLAHPEWDPEEERTWQEWEAMHS